MWPFIAPDQETPMRSSQHREPEPETEDEEPEGDVDDLPRPAFVGLRR
jgi:hypothetical protein